MMRFTIALFALCALAVSAPSMAEPVTLDNHGAPAEEKPAEPKSVTVPAGTAMMVRTSGEVSSKDQPGRKFSATLEANLMAGGDIAAKAGTQVYGQVVKSVQAGRGIVVSHANLVLGLTDINVEGTMYPIQTGSYAEDATGVILKRKSVVIPSGSLLEFRLTTPLTIKK